MLGLSGALIIVAMVLWAVGFLGNEALLALLPFGFAGWSQWRSKQGLKKLRDQQVTEHGMKTGDPKYWGRGENKD